MEYQRSINQLNEIAKSSISSKQYESAIHAIQVKNILERECDSILVHDCSENDCEQVNNSEKNLEVEIVNVGGHVPSYQTKNASGMDLKAVSILKKYKDTTEISFNKEYRNPLEPQFFTIQPFEKVIFGTGLKMALPKGYEAHIRPRSGICLKTDLSVFFGTIDADYRGEIGIIAKNVSNHPINIKVGDRLAQIVVIKVEKVKWNVTSVLPETERNEGGFGHTGV